MVRFNEAYTASAYNALIAPAGIEVITDASGNKLQYGPFNKLLIKNRSAVAIKFTLDGLETSGNIYELAAGETFILDPEIDDINFMFIKIENIDAAVNAAADTILVRWALAVVVE